MTVTPNTRRTIFSDHDLIMIWGNSLIEKRSHSLLVECMGVPLKIVFLKTTFNSTKQGT